MFTQKAWEDLDITDNFIFLKVMQRGDICRRFLTHLLRVPLERVSYPETEKTVDTAFNAKAVRLDVFAEAEGQQYDIEMQTTNDPKENPVALRSRYYQSAMDQFQLGKGKNYAQLGESFVIFICTFDPFGLGRAQYTFRYRCDEDPDLVLNDKTTKIFLYIYGDTEGLDAELCGFLRYAAGLPATGRLAQDVDEAVRSVKADANARKEFMTLAMEMQRYVDTHQDDWYADGKADGEAKGKTDAARAMLADNMSIPLIAKYTGLSLEQIQALNASTQPGSSGSTSAPAP